MECNSLHKETTALVVLRLAVNIINDHYTSYSATLWNSQSWGGGGGGFDRTPQTPTGYGPAYLAEDSAEFYANMKCVENPTEFLHVRNPNFRPVKREHTWQDIRVTIFADIALHVCLCVV